MADRQGGSLKIAGDESFHFSRENSVALYVQRSYEATVQVNNLECYNYFPNFALNALYIAWSNSLFINILNR